MHTHSHEQRKSIKNTRLFDDSPPQGRGHQKRRFAAFAFQKYDFKLNHQKHELFWCIFLLLVMCLAIWKPWPSKISDTWAILLAIEWELARCRARDTKKRHKHVQKWALKWNHTFGRPAVAQRIASRLLFGGTNRRKESCFWHFFNCFWLHPWLFGGPLARFRCLAWLEIENPSCFWTKFRTTLILLIKMKQISVDELFCQKHSTFWLLELSSAVEARFASFLWAKSKSRRFLRGSRLNFPRAFDAFWW